MKKNILILLVLSLIFSCSTKRKATQRSTFLKGFKTYYNTLFNANEALKEEIKTREESYEENFFQQYIPIFSYEDKVHLIKNESLPMDNPQMDKSLGINHSLSLQKNSRNTRNNNSSNNDNEEKAEPATILEIAEAKALKSIEKFSVIKNFQEKNKMIFDAYLILAKARILKGEYVGAIDALEQMYPKMREDKRIPLAKIYQAVSYSKLKDYKKANKIFDDLKMQKLGKEETRLLSIYRSENLLNEGRKEEAALELLTAFDVNSNRKIKSRIAFLRGQILNSLDRKTEARESFQNAYKYANDFEFEVKSQIEIAKTYSNKNDYQSAKEYLEKLSKKGTYASRKNEFYYALGLMANKIGKKDEAMDFFHQSLKENVSDPQIRGLSYFEIGKNYFDKNDYISAGVYYDSALVSMTYEPMKVELIKQSENIKKLSKNYYLIKKNDSILALTKMSKTEQENYFKTFINQLKAKEEKLKKEQLIAERNRGFEDDNSNANSIFGRGNTTFQNFGEQTNSFYFSNTNTVAKGETEFKQVWGDRPLSDNWRYSKQQGSLEDLKNEALGLDNTPNPRRFEAEFYIEKIPTDTDAIAQLVKDRDTASLGLGTMYFDLFSNKPLATETLYDLVDRKPVEKVMLLALYKIFSMNYEDNPQAAARAKNILLTDYPYTSYAEFARNPKSTNFIKSNPKVMSNYKKAFDFYTEENFAESIALIEQTMDEFPKDAMIPKLSLLKAFNTGKTVGKEVMILQLNQIALNYEDTEEGRKAKEMLAFLKSELEVVKTNKEGEKIEKEKPEDKIKQQPPNKGSLFGTDTSFQPQRPPRPNRDLKKKK